MKTVAPTTSHSTIHGKATPRPGRAAGAKIRFTNQPVEFAKIASMRSSTVWIVRRLGGGIGGHRLERFLDGFGGRIVGEPARRRRGGDGGVLRRREGRRAERREQEREARDLPEISHGRAS